MHHVFRVFRDHLEHDLCKPLVKLGSQALLYLTLNLLLGDDIAIAPAARHGVVSIGNGNDPGFFGISVIVVSISAPMAG